MMLAVSVRGIKAIYVNSFRALSVQNLDNRF